MTAPLAPIIGPANRITFSELFELPAITPTTAPKNVIPAAVKVLIFLLFLEVDSIHLRFSFISSRPFS